MDRYTSGWDKAAREKAISPYLDCQPDDNRIDVALTTMTWIARAKEAEGIADALSKFTTPVHEHAPEITASISELYAIGSGLREIDTALGPYSLTSRSLSTQRQLDPVCSRLNTTLRNIFQILGSLGEGHLVLNDSMYRKTWRDISWFFRQNGQGILPARLGIYKTFICEAAQDLKRDIREKPLIDFLRTDIQSPAPGPDGLPDLVNGLSLAARAPLAKPRSYERGREPNPPALQTDPREMRLPTAPDVPTSPSSATQTTSQSSSTNPECHHWATQVYQDTSTTSLTQTEEVSRCYGDSVTAETQASLREDFEEILEAEFGGRSKLTVRLYHRPFDHRARILCKWLRGSGGGSKCSCLPLNVLHFYRIDSALQICTRRSGKSELDPWARLVFTTIERLTIFHCTLLALRAQDNGKSVGKIQDYELAGEEGIFGGNESFNSQIIDDGYHHALSVYLDHASKAVRLQATVHRGEMKRVPVWTAFITHYLVSTSWLRKVSPTTIYLGELRPHLFSSDYEEQITPRGEHVLKFGSEDDATAFICTIDDLARKYARPPPALPPKPKSYPQQPARKTGQMPQPPLHRPQPVPQMGSMRQREQPAQPMGPIPPPMQPRQPAPQLRPAYPPAPNPHWPHYY